MDDDKVCVKMNVKKFKETLKKYQDYSDSNKNKNSKYLLLVSREYVKNEMNSSIIQYYNI